jgi:hypothetical protein
MKFFFVPAARGDDCDGGGSLHSQAGLAMESTHPLLSPPPEAEAETAGTAGTGTIAIDESLNCIIYWAQQTVRCDENYSLFLASWLASACGLPLIAVVSPKPLRLLSEYLTTIPYAYAYTYTYTY